jgi:hypothetical protein
MPKYQMANPSAKAIVAAQIAYARDVGSGSMNEAATAVACGNEPTTSVEARGKRG